MDESCYILLMSEEKVTPLLGFSWELLLLSLREFLLFIPWSGNISRRCRLFCREEGNPPLLERRCFRLHNMAAGETMPRGGTLPIFSYSSSISLFWAVWRVCTSIKCFSRSFCCSSHMSSSLLSVSSLLRCAELRL